MKKQKKAFTLVELIVVITILAILGTIAFLSFQGYSKTARDSKRISDISTIATGLKIFYSTSGKYPRSGENEVGLYGGNIGNNGNLLGYQASAGQNVLNNIKMSSKGGIDPLDNSYYTYSTNKKQNKFQILGFLESFDNVALEGSKVSYSQSISRYPFTRGDELGILIENTGSTLTPFQYIASIPSDIDIIDSSFEDNYPSVVGVKDYRSSPTTNVNIGSDLLMTYAGLTPSPLLLVHGDGSNLSTTFADSSSFARGINVNTTLGGDSPYISTTHNKFGGSSIYFPGASYLEVPLNGTDFNFTNGENFTFDFWTMFDGIDSINAGGYSRTAHGFFGGGDGSYISLIHNHDNDNGFVLVMNDGDGWRDVNPHSAKNDFIDGEWYHIAVVRKVVDLVFNYKVFVNGKIIINYNGNGNISTPVDNIRIGTGPSDGYTFKGYIDEFHISKGALWESNFTPPANAY